MYLELEYLPQYVRFLERRHFIIVMRFPFLSFFFHFLLLHSRISSPPYGSFPYNPPPISPICLSVYKSTCSSSFQPRSSKLFPRSLHYGIPPQHIFVTSNVNTPKTGKGRAPPSFLMNLQRQRNLHICPLYHLSYSTPIYP